MSNFMDSAYSEALEARIQHYYGQLVLVAVAMHREAYTNGQPADESMIAVAIGMVDAVCGAILAIQAGRGEAFDRSAFLALIAARLDRVQPAVTESLARFTATAGGTLQ